jgi:LPXTG-motif cell wall-anchored protein
MKKLKVNKIILTLAVVFAVILGLTVIANADEIQAINPSDVVTSNSTGNTNANANTNANSNSNSANNNTARNNTTTYNNTNANANTNTNLPKTGLTDYSVLFVVIGALAVIGIVAYKKANYYKDI